MHGLKEAVLKDCAFAKDFSLGNTCSIGLVDFLYEILSFSPNLLQAAEKTSACSFDLGSAIFLVGWVCVMCFLCCHSSETKQTNLLTNLYVSIALQVAVRCMIPRRLILSDVQILQAAYTLVHCIQESSCFYCQSQTVCSVMTVTIISSIYCEPSSAIVALHMKVARKPSICESKQYTHKHFCLVQTSPGARYIIFSHIPALVLTH